MFIDGKLQFDSENALSASAASTDVLDLDIKRNIGVGEPMAVVISLDSVADDTDGNEIKMTVDNFVSTYSIGGGATLTQEEVEDFAGAMFTGNSETLIVSTYDDGTGKITLVVDDDLSLYDNSTSNFLSGSISLSDIFPTAKD